MPTYDYQCDACDHKFEELQSFSEPVLTKCPQCGKKKLRRLLGTGAAVLFKGSGFYETDYRSDSYKNAAKKDQEQSQPAKSESSEAKSGDAKTGTTSEGGKAAKKPEKSPKSAT